MGGSGRRGRGVHRRGLPGAPALRYGLPLVCFHHNKGRTVHAGDLHPRARFSVIAFRKPETVADAYLAAAVPYVLLHDEYTADIGNAALVERRMIALDW